MRDDSTLTRWRALYGPSSRCVLSLDIATAELTGLTVLHCDKDFDLIAVVTGQPVERLNVT